MSPFLQIAVNVPSVTGVFDYHLPPELEGKVGVGSLVIVPFGKQNVQGVALRFISQPSVPETKAVSELLDPAPVLTAAQIALAQELAEVSLNPLAEMIGLMLPPGLAQQADRLYMLAKDPGQATRVGPHPSVVGQRLLGLLQQRGSLRGRQIDRHFRNLDWRKSAQALVRQGVLASQSVLPPPTVRAKFIRTAQLAVPPETAESALPGLGRTPDTLKRRQSALRFLIHEPQAVDTAWVYAESGCTLADLQELAERELIVLRETEIWRDPLVKIDQAPLEAPVLTRDQQRVWNEIESAFQTQAEGQPVVSFLLHGVTGSGKTEIYLRAAQEAIRRGRQAIVLVPEIAMTPQTVRRFLARFPGQVGLVHSRLSEGERYDTWRRARLGLLKVLIGPRSALFAPLPNIGLIAVDECHDGSYYQSEPPFYHAVNAAQIYARLCGAICILGSATPPVILRYRARPLPPTPPPAPFGNASTSVRSSPREAQAGGELRLLELPERITSASERSPAPSRALPPVHVIDMRTELKSGNRGIFSRELVEALGAVLQAGQQAILFLNRRGTATYIFCRDCGMAVRCPRCETPLTYHSPGEVLTCHHCGYRRQMLKKCPNCGSDQIRQYGLGSERVEAEVGSLFPEARTLRWDWETTRQKDSHEIILTHFSAHRADVLIGTQMLAKGLDLPLVTLVGIVLADVGLNLPDPFAAERTFSVLTQVAGRAGRSALGGRVILQTYQPEHYTLQAAQGHDYAAFYLRELEYRRQLGYPPFGQLVRLEYRHAQADKAESEARALAARINQWIKTEDRRQTTLLGPAPCFYARLNGLYRWQLILRGPDPVSLLRAHPLSGWRVEVDPISLL